MVTRATACAALFMIVWYGLAASPVAVAQGTPRATAGAPARGESVRLLVRPRVGDTLWLQIEQRIEVRARRIPVGGNGTAGPDYGPRAVTAPMQATRLLLFAHSLVESSDLQATQLLATSDSIAMSMSTGGESAAPRLQPIADEVRQVRVQVRPDGSMRMQDPPPNAASFGATLASVPGLLPDAPVRVGAEWTREMALPSLPVGGLRARGVVQVRLRLDSLTGNGRDAWISLSGRLRRSGTSADWPPGAHVVTAGTIRGSMQVDRQRAWIVNAFTEIEVASELAPGPGGGTPSRGLLMHIVQQVRVR